MHEDSLSFNAGPTKQSTLGTGKLWWPLLMDESIMKNINKAPHYAAFNKEYHQRVAPTALTCSHHVADRGQFTKGGVVGQDGLDGDFVRSTADVSLLTEVAKTWHGYQHRLRVRTPEEHIEAHLQLRLGLPANRNPTAHRRRILERLRTKRTVNMAFVSETDYLFLGRCASPCSWAETCSCIWGSPSAIWEPQSH